MDYMLKFTPKGVVVVVEVEPLVFITNELVFGEIKYVFTLFNIFQK